MPIRVLQLSDLHLFADPSQRLAGVPTRESLIEVRRFIDSQPGSFDHVIITGDFTHDELAETYESVRDILGDWVDRCRIVPGNHDDRGAMRQVFQDLIPTSTGAVTFSFHAGGWRLIGLDTHVPGRVPGRIESEQLDWLRQEFASHAEEPAMLFMHHPPVPVGCSWLDSIGLEEPEELLDLIAANGQVRLVSAGHVHHVFDGEMGHVRVVTTPSTAVQFKPQGDEPIYDHVPPGYRVITLDGETFETEVVRLPELRFPPGERDSG